MSGFRLAPDAQSDLLDIRRFTASQWGVAQAQRYLADFRRAMQLFAESLTLSKARPGQTWARMSQVFPTPAMSSITSSMSSSS